MGAIVWVLTSGYYDLEAVCATCSTLVRPACDSLAWTYCEAVYLFGSVVVSRADLAHAAALKAGGEAAADVQGRWIPAVP